MTSSDSLEWRLARVAHEDWCRRMIAAGWTPGGVFQADAHVHDALVPFDELDAVDRRSVYVGIVAADCAELVRTAVDYPRGDHSELKASDMAVGLRVRRTDVPEHTGTVLSWVEDAAFPGALDTITVKWDSGEIVEHAAAEGELAVLLM